jgi:phosphate acetyltransferase
MSMFQDSEIGAITTGGPFGHPPPSKYEKLISLAKEVPPATTVVVHPCDETSLRGASAAAEMGIIVPVLVGPVARIIAVAKQHGIDIARYELVDAPHSEAAAAKAVELIRESKGEILTTNSCAR